MKLISVMLKFIKYLLRSTVDLFVTCFIKSTSVIILEEVRYLQNFSLFYEGRLEMPPFFKVHTIYYLTKL